MKKQKKNWKILRLYATFTLAIGGMTGTCIQTYKLDKANKQILTLEAKTLESQKNFSELNSVYDKHDDGSYSLTTEAVRVRLWTNEDGIYDLKVTEQGGYMRELNNEKIVSAKQ